MASLYSATHAGNVPRTTVQCAHRDRPRNTRARPGVDSLRHAPPDPNAGQRLSDVLTSIANDAERVEISFADIRDAMGDRAFGALMFVFAAPNALPVNAPGVSVVLGLPLLFLSLQLMLGFAVPWLPRFVVRRRVRRQSFARVMNHAIPWIRRAEKLSRPRLSRLATGPAERVIGLISALLCLVLVLPIPFGNMGPAVAICILALALLERDGMATIIGFATGIVATVLASGVIIAIVKGISLLVRHWLGF